MATWAQYSASSPARAIGCLGKPRAPSSGSFAKSQTGCLRHGDLRIQVHVLDRVHQRKAFFPRTLKGFAPEDQTHSAGALVDHGRTDGVLEVRGGFALAARV